MKARYTRRALGDVERILAHISEHNAAAAKQVSAHIKKAVRRVEKFPYSARPTKVDTVRVLPLIRYPYLIFYAVDEVAHEVRILRIRHDARSPLKRFN